MRVLSLLIFSFCFLLACRKDESLFKIENLNGDTITVIGHAGMGNSYRYSGDTYESLSEAIKIGVHGVEMDVQMTLDSVLVLYHHAHLEEATSCSGSINEKIWDDIKNCFYNEKTGKPALLSAVDFFESDAGRAAKYFVLDLKQTDTSLVNNRRFARVILRTLQKFDLTAKCNVESSFFYLLKLFETEPSLKLFVYADKLEDGLDVAEQVRITGITIDMEKITGDEIARAHDNGLQIALFNARTEKLNAQAMLLSPDYIQTDRVEYLMNIVNK